MKKLAEDASLTPDQLTERWKLWLKETEQEAFQLYASRFLFENIQMMFKSNQSLLNNGSHVYSWIARNFFTQYLISVRKEMERGGRYLTLANFLIELERHSETVLTRRRFVALYTNPTFVALGIPDADFDYLRGAMCRWPKTDREDDCISSNSVKRSLDDLESDTQRAVNYANWFIAHRTRNKPLTLTFKDMYASVNRIFDVYALYNNMITGRTWANRYPEPQYDWTEPFTIPWIADGFEPFEPPR